MRISTSKAKKVGDALGVNWNKVDLKQFTRGINVEYAEHKDVTNRSFAKSGKIALAHLKEISNYYTHLDKMEKKAHRR